MSQCELKTAAGGEGETVRQNGVETLIHGGGETVMRLVGGKTLVGGGGETMVRQGVVETPVDGAGKTVMRQGGFYLLLKRLLSKVQWESRIPVPDILHIITLTVIQSILFYNF